MVASENRHSSRNSFNRTEHIKVCEVWQISAHRLFSGQKISVIRMYQVLIIDQYVDQTDQKCWFIIRPFPSVSKNQKSPIYVFSHVLKRAHLGYLSGSSKKCSNNSDWLRRTRENLIVLIRYVQKIGQTKTRHYESMVRQWLDSSRQAGIDKLPDNCQVLAKAKKPPALSQASQQGGDLPPLRALVLNKYSHHLLQITHVD